MMPEGHILGLKPRIGVPSVCRSGVEGASPYLDGAFFTEGIATLKKAVVKT